MKLNLLRLICLIFFQKIIALDAKKIKSTIINFQKKHLSSLITISSNDYLNKVRKISESNFNLQEDIKNNKIRNIFYLIGSENSFNL